MESNRIFWTLACDLTDLFVVHYLDMSICKRHVKSPFEKKQEWLGNEIMCEQGDQLIGSVRIDEEKKIVSRFLISSINKKQMISF